MSCAAVAAATVSVHDGWGPLLANVGYVYPQGEGPGVPQTGFGPIEVPLGEFKKLMKVPMQMVWGDNVDKSAS